MSNIIESLNLLPVIKAKKNNNGAEFTIKSIKTNKEFTYIISRSEFNGNWYTHIKVEKGYRNFVRLGSYFDGKIFNKKQLISTPSAKAIAYVLSKIEAGVKTLDNAIEVRHGGNCMRCGRELSDSVSLDRGLGPTCASY